MDENFVDFLVRYSDLKNFRGDIDHLRFSGSYVDRNEIGNILELCRSRNKGDSLKAVEEIYLFKKLISMINIHRKTGF